MLSTFIYQYNKNSVSAFIYAFYLIKRFVYYMIMMLESRYDWMGVIDTHAHILSEHLYSRFDEVVENAKKEGVEKILIICTDVHQGKLAIEKAKEDSMFDVAIGFHPSELLEMSKDDWVQLELLCRQDEVIAVGEIGLDYHWDTVDHETQKEAFIKQINLANELQKPIIIHMRDATKDTMNILKEHAKFGGILHCYSGSAETAKEAIKLGFYISFAGIITFKNAHHALDIVKDVPLNRMFVETDSPYLAPHPYRGKQNESKYVIVTFEKVCEVLQLNSNEVMLQMKENYERLFKKRG